MDEKVYKKEIHFFRIAIYVPLYKVKCLFRKQNLCFYVLKRIITTSLFIKVGCNY